MTFLPPPSPRNFDRCGCGAVLSEDVYRTELSCGDAADYGCQRCQDLRFLGASGSRSDVDLRHGVLVAHTVHVGPSRGEICLLPFLATACGSRIAWETHRIVRIGSALTHVDPWSELAPLEDSLEGHRIHIDRVSSTRAPLVRERLGIADLVVGVDETSRDVIARLPVPDDADVTILAADISWSALYGREFAPLETWCDPSGGVQSTLRLAALMVYVLDLGAPSEGLRPVEHLMAKFEPRELAYPLSVPHEEVSHARA